MPYYKKIAGEICYLSPCNIEDAELWTKWDNDLEVTIPMGEEAYLLYSLEREKEMMSNMLKKESYVFDIVDIKEERLIGRCMLFNVDQVNRTAMFGIVIGEKEYWNRGYGKEATSLLLDYGFNLLNLHNIMLGVYSFNNRGLRCYRKVGFKEIGRRRQARIFGDQKYDMVFMDILAEEFQSVVVKAVLEKQ
jgi:RimJ/RimL family protein N-acetyltransferase